MGGTTPRFGIRFPQQGEVVTLAHFKNLADDLDLAADTVEANRTKALRRPAVRLSGPWTGQGAPNMTQATLTIMPLRGGTAGSTLYWDTDNMVDPTFDDRINIKTAGIYSFMAAITGNNGVATTMTAMELQVTVNGTILAMEKWNVSNWFGQTDMQVAGVWKFNLNDVVQVKLMWRGTGGPYQATVELDMHMICQL